MKIFYPERASTLFDVLESLANFMENNVLPNSSKFDRREIDIKMTRKALLENGICRIPFPEEYGGLNLPFPIYALAIEIAGYSDASIALSIAIHNTVADGINMFGNYYQKKRYLKSIISGEKLAAFCLTEPSSGSDAKRMATRASKESDEYIINGSKMFITNAGEADIYMVFASTDNGPSCFIVEGNTPGLYFGDDLPKLGMKGSRTSEVRFEDCRVPSANLIGQEGMGFEYAKSMLNGSRIVMGSICVGIAQLAYEKAISYSKQRRAFGQPISDFQLIREKIANMSIDISAARLLCIYASRLREIGVEHSSEASKAKVFATEMSIRVCDDVIQIFGGYGYTNDDIHRHWRDARLLTIGEGTSEVLRMLIARKELARSL